MQLNMRSAVIPARSLWRRTEGIASMELLSISFIFRVGDLVGGTPTSCDRGGRAPRSQALGYGSNIGHRAGGIAKARQGFQTHAISHAQVKVG